MQNVGPVLAGTLKSGVVRVGDSLKLGPMPNGMFEQVTIASLHRNRTPTRVIQAGQTACIALRDTSGIVVRRVSSFYFRHFKNSSTKQVGMLSCFLI